MDDDNFTERFEYFYKNIAPQIRLYPFRVGDIINLRSYTRSGFLKTVPLKIHGLYEFSGLESSDLAGAFNFVDLVSYRELYGRMSSEGRRELEALQSEVNIQRVGADSIEDALFGEDSVIETRSESRPAENSSLTTDLNLSYARTATENYDPKELNSGLVINAAVVLKNPRRIQSTLEELSRQFEQAGLRLQVVDWKQASGTLGQLVSVIRAVLLVAVGIILIVAMAIINNAIMMTTLERTKEIGTLRAIGAQRGFVLRMFCIETLTIGLLATVSGALTAVTLLVYLGQAGIAAPSDFVSFLFGGPRLYPTFTLDLILLAPITVAVLALIFTLYPAYMASKVSPATAMQDRE